MNRLFALLAEWGPVGLFGLAAIESLGIPNPGGTDIALVALAASQRHSAVLIAAMATLGSLAGTTIFFEVARRGGEALLAKYTRRGRAAKFRDWYRRYGMLTVFVSGMLPLPFLPFKAFVACAGALGVPRARFVALLAAARVPRYGSLAYLGTRLGPDSWPWVRAHLWHLTVAAVLLFAALYAALRWMERRASRAESP